MNFLRWCPACFTQPASNHHLKMRIFSRSNKNGNNEFPSIPSFQACCSSQSMRNTESSVSFEEAWDLISKKTVSKGIDATSGPTVPLHYLAFCGLEHVKAGFLHVHMKCGINVEIHAKTWISDGHLAGWNCLHISSGAKIEALFVDTLSYVYIDEAAVFSVCSSLLQQGLSWAGTSFWQWELATGNLGLSVTLLYVPCIPTTHNWWQIGRELLLLLGKWPRKTYTTPTLSCTYNASFSNS